MSAALELEQPTRLLTVAEVAEASGFTRRAISNACQRGELRAVKRLGQWRIRLADYEAWIDAGEWQPPEQAEDPVAAAVRELRPRHGRPAAGSEPERIAKLGKK